MKTIEILMFLVASLFLVGVAICFVREVFLIWKAKQPKPKITITSGLGPPPLFSTEEKVERFLKNINEKLKDTPYVLMADIRDGSISVIEKFIAITKHCSGLTEGELLTALFCIDLALGLKEGEKS